MERLRVIIDTREQSPWSFPAQFAAVTIHTITSGDYALAGDDAHFAIERKSLDDFLGTISSGWERFCRELDRMEESGFVARVVIVEADFEAVCFREEAGEVVPPRHNHPNLTPQFVAKRVAELVMRGVCVLFAGHKAYAAALALKILQRRAEQIAGETVE
jgi:hypothetical protein